MMDDSAGLIPQTLPSIQQPLSKLDVLPANLTAGPGTEVCTKATVLFELLPPKGHIRTVRGARKRAYLHTQIKCHIWTHGAWVFGGQPPRERPRPYWDNPS